MLLTILGYVATVICVLLLAAALGVVVGEDQKTWDKAEFVPETPECDCEMCAWLRDLKS